MKQFMQGVFAVCSLGLAMLVLASSGCQPQAAPAPDPAQKLKPFTSTYVEVWNGASVAKLDSIVDPLFVRHVNAQPDIDGIVALKAAITGFRTAYPDLKIAIHDELYTEGKSAARWSFAGTNTGPGEMQPTGKAVKVWGLSIIRFANGKAVEEWIGFDNQEFMSQLGFTIVPPAGEKPKKGK